MRILFVTRFFPPDTGGGGIASYANYISQGLLQRGHEVRVISQLARNSKPYQDIGGIQVIRIPSDLKSYRLTRLPIVGRQIRLVRDILYASRIRRMIKRMSAEFKPDIVEYADIDAEGALHPNICPFVVKLHTPHSILRNFSSPFELPYSTRGIEFLENLTIKRANGVSSPSFFLAKEMARECHIDESVINWIQNLIDTDFFSPIVRSEDDDTKTILYVGRLEPRKGALVFTKAIPEIAKIFPNVRYVFLGVDRKGTSGGSQKVEILDELEKVNLRDSVQFHGHASPLVFREFYRKASVFVMPSLFENCPYTLLEAMSCACPSVVSNAGGMPEIIENGKNGLLFSSGNASELADGVSSILTNPSLGHEFGVQARKTVIEKYSIPVGAQAAEQFYNKLITVS